MMCDHIVMMWVLLSFSLCTWNHMRLSSN